MQSLSTALTIPIQRAYNRLIFRPSIYIAHGAHEHDRTYSENLVKYLRARGVTCKRIELNLSPQRPELEQCLDDMPTAVLGYNAQLDHSWVSAGRFLTLAAARYLPVIQWILDHPCARWGEFHASTRRNSAYLLNTPYEERYFHRYCLPGAVTSTAGGVGANARSEAKEFSRDSFSNRPINCLIPISLSRLGRTVQQLRSAINLLDGPLSAAVDEAILNARFDLDRPLEDYLVKALDKVGATLDNKTFNYCFWLVEDSVQAIRRLKVFEVARQFPVLIQSDSGALPFLEGGVATYAVDIGMQETLNRMTSCRAVLSVSPLNDMIHDRTVNGLNAACAVIAEDNSAYRSIFQHGKNALLFRYDDDSLRECLEIVCNDPQRTFEIAQEGLKLRSNEQIPFAGFHNIVRLARRQAAAMWLSPLFA